MLCSLLTRQEQLIELFAILICSGTMGAPKGVEVTHANIVSGIAALQTYTEHIGIEVRRLPAGSNHCMHVSEVRPWPGWEAKVGAL